ncbi:MAG: 5-formyltetrahydrofolate cyclo-ligase [Patescibacteria group bacterium]
MRSEIHAACRGLSSREHAKQSSTIAQKLFALPEYTEAQVVALYASLPEEVSTDAIIKHSLKVGKRVVLPRIYPGFPLVENELEFCEIKKMEDLEVSVFGIREPNKNCPVVSLGKIDLLVAPVVACDEQGRRLGKGEGFYDRVLENFSGKTVALAFDCQMVEKIPAEEHDQKVDQVLSVKRET